jgi:hypothetical protein
MSSLSLDNQCINFRREISPTFLDFGLVKSFNPAVYYFLTLWVLSTGGDRRGSLDLQLLHHFIEGTDIDTTDINSGTSDIDTTDINSGTSDICTVQLFQLPTLSPFKVITTDNQSASPSRCQVPIWDPRPIFLSRFSLRQLLLLYSALSDEKTSL